MHKKMFGSAALASRCFSTPLQSDHGGGDRLEISWYVNLNPVRTAQMRSGQQDETGREKELLEGIADLRLASSLLVP